MRILYDRVAAEEILPEEKTAGGIILLPNDDIKFRKGIVKLVGPQAEVKPGQTIIWDKEIGAEVNYTGDTLIEMNGNEILAIAE